MLEYNVGWSVPGPDFSTDGRGYGPASVLPSAWDRTTNAKRSVGSVNGCDAIHGKAARDRASGRTEFRPKEAIYSDEVKITLVRSKMIRWLVWPDL